VSNLAGRPRASSTTTYQSSPVGRPRQPATDRKILDATRELLVEGGVRALAVEGVAARSGVAKTTIYRRYRSKNELALAVLIDMVRTVAAVPDLGDTRAELTRFVRATVKVLAESLMGRIMQGLVSDLADDAELAAAFRDRVVALRMSEVRRIVQRGQQRGDVRLDADVDLVHDMLFGPVYYRLLLSGAPLERGLADAIVNAIYPTLLENANPRRRTAPTTKRVRS
jgi:AcrR family transcriptional regulator